jgi:hypothetical protein
MQLKINDTLNLGQGPFARRWTVPIGGGLSKTFRLGEQPVQLGVYAYYNGIRPTAGQDPWQPLARWSHH